MNSIFFRALFCACCFITLLASCEADTTSVSDVGEDWINNGTKVFYIDTFSVETSTYKFDSLAITGNSRYIMGAYTDPILGRIEATPYFELYTDDFDIDEDAVFDSVALLLNYTDYYYNDTLSRQKFNVYKVLEEITPDDDASYFYNTTTFKTETTSIGSIDFLPTPIREDSIHFTLNNAFGKEIFEDIQDNEINNTDEFTQKYYGISIVSDASNSAVLGIATDSKLRIYYSIPDVVEDDEYYYDLTFNSSASFHNITQTTTNPDLSSLVDQSDEISSTETDNLTYIQGGSGLATRVDIPYIETINTLNGSGSIMDANLRISLKHNSNTDNLSVRDSLNVYIIDQFNDTSTQLVDYTGSVVYGLQVEDELNNDYVTYVISIKYFLDLKLNEVNPQNLILGFTCQGFNESVDRYILEGEDSDESDLKATLELNYALYDDEYEY
ncbi:DUF4270 family protein [Formosa algae]|uniref:DUF4270 domain-containing protein n=1 Tax=Formosa algae TaxID=225843 RepID=A0A9X1C9Z3_9FLAO|nr:DUF4270 family protein [Formosa algae]MBP1841188.1 hypothetical protein [Formosa algae]MDQ0336392.1 hypothetical protein [Formosa algae]OEI81358.1 hypothetical protein AST99_03740 [Formosa algae]PNW27899.1 hypothetical protein BKP44_10760 [Formosa algae]